MMKPFVSVIVPVYNAERYLSSCVKSLQAQTLKEMECIFIDDHSTDHSLSLLKEQTASMPPSQVKIVALQQNGGVAHARNTGLDLAQGEYVIHADSDDWLEPDMLERMYELAKERDADLVGCNFFNEYDKRQTTKVQPYSDDMQANMRRLLDGRIFPSLWSSLVRRDLIKSHGITFPDGLNMGEDLLFLVKVYSHAKRIAWTDKPLYHYRHSPHSLCATKSRTGVDTDIRIAGKIEAYLQSQGLQHLYQTEVAYRKFFSKLPLIAGFRDRSAYKEWLAIYPETHKHVLNFSLLDKKLRAELWLAIHGLWLAAKAMSRFLDWQHRMRERLNTT